MKYVLSFMMLYLILTSCNQSPNYVLSDKIPPIDQRRKAKVLSAFFGLDNALPKSAIGISPKAPGSDGMPVVFSQELDPTSLDASDFKIRTKQGVLYNVEVVTLQPANEAFELRTVLLIGEFGNYPDNEPIEVEVVQDLKTRNGQNYKGQKVSVTPLIAGPFLSYAEYFTLEEDYPYVSKGKGCDCPKEETSLVVRTVWSGGVRGINGEELGGKDLLKFKVILEQEKDTLIVSPFFIADIGDNDNNIDLCLKQNGTPFLVNVKANTAIDPRGDANEYSEVHIYSRW